MAGTPLRCSSLKYRMAASFIVDRP
ncbi:uncharacterized protein G2W53_033948 [Senna tora]|uniref:Uncharacterized protein n=1 Tax=Senna tora TaxID=362788 RepID=A0A834T365_9FABA|nr:uncharacterized protein G2W53_033948 [Senna tora]